MNRQSTSWAGHNNSSRLSPTPTTIKNNPILCVVFIQIKHLDTIARPIHAEMNKTLQIASCKQISMLFSIQHLLQFFIPCLLHNSFAVKYDPQKHSDTILSFILTYGLRQNGQHVGLLLIILPGFITFEYSLFR